LLLKEAPDELGMFLDPMEGPQMVDFLGPDALGRAGVAAREAADTAIGIEHLGDLIRGSKLEHPDRTDVDTEGATATAGLFDRDLRHD
jgi:hypothetical protein